MDNYIGVFLEYGQGLHRQLPRRAVIRVIGLKPEESAKLVGWVVGWPAAEPRIFGKIVSRHGKGGSLTASFKRGLPGEALAKQVIIMSEKPKSKEAPKKSERSPSVNDVEGIGTKYTEKLAAENIHTVAELLEAGATPGGRKVLAEKLEVSQKLVLEWVNLADLFRIKGVGEEYADLLEEAGVDTVVELAKRKPENLHEKMVEVNGKKELVRKVPSLADVERWVEEAKTLPRKVEY